MGEDNTNNQLIKRLQNDDKEAFDEIYWKYHSAIYFNILKLTREAIVAEDIVQEVFIALWEKRFSLDRREISGWLFVVSYNKSVSYLKLKLKESLLHSTLQQNDDNIVEVEDDLFNTRITVLEKAIEQLSPQKEKYLSCVSCKEKLMQKLLLNCRFQNIQ